DSYCVNTYAKHPFRVCHHNRHHHSTGSLSVTTIDTIRSTGSLSIHAIVSVWIKSSMDCKKVYPKDSLDRLGDDLCQHLLSFLSLEDRFRCECVSKQWQRVVYETQTELTIDPQLMGSTISEESFETLLQKCENITRIEFLCFNDLNDTIIDSIAKHCHHLNAIYIENNFGLNDSRIERLFKRFAKQLKSIECQDMGPNSGDHNCIADNIKFCTHLTRLGNSFYNNMRLYRVVTGDETDVLFKRLTSFQFTYSNEDVKCFDVFVNRYQNQMKSMDVFIDETSEDLLQKSVDILMSGLSRMRALIDLKIHCSEKTLSDIIADQLRHIGANCGQLRRLSIDVYMRGHDSRHISDQTLWRLMQTINDNFHGLRRLRFSDPIPKPLTINVNDLMQTIDKLKLMVCLERVGDRNRLIGFSCSNQYVITRNITFKLMMFY
ncbi:unnamed protein product, partial [Oppiella nova]